MLKIFLFCFWFMLMFPVILDAKNVPDSREVSHVLMLVSYDMTHSWTNDLVQTVVRQNEKLPVRMVYTTLELDALRIRNPEVWEQQFQVYLKKIRAGKFNFIFVFDDVAVRLLLRHYKDLPPGIPIVFAGYENCPTDLKQQYPNITGVIQNFGTEETIRTALDLYPKTKTFVVLSDSSESSRAFEKRIRETIRTRAGVHFLFLDNREKDISKLFRRLKALPAESLILISPWRGLADNDYQSLPAFGLDLADAAKHPYLVSEDTLLGYGALGGVLTKASDHGMQMSEVIADVIRRGGAEYVPVRQGRIMPFFDYAQLNAENLDLSKLPSNTRFRNLPPTFWDAHGSHLLWLFGAGGILLFFVFGYALAVKRTTKRSLRILESLPGRVGVLNAEEKILFMNGDCSFAAAYAGKLKDIPNIDYEKVSAGMQKVLHTGQPLSMEYEYKMVKRSLSIAPLAKDVFGENAIIWFSHDNQEMQNIRIRAEQIAAQLKKQTKLWDLLINSLPIHIFAKNPDRDFQYVFCNHAMLDFHAMSNSEITGKYDSELFDGPLSRKIREYDEKVMNNPENNLSASVFQVTDRNGVSHYFQSIKRMFLGDDGSRLLLGASIDVTELEETRNTLHDMLAQHHLLLDNMPGFAFTMDIDHDFRYTSCNKAVLNMWGLTEQEAIGKNDLEIFDRKTGEFLMRTNRGLAEKEDFRERITPYISPTTGEARIARLSLKRLNLSGDRHWLFGFGVDITEEEKLKNELQDSVAIFQLLMDHIPCHIVAKDIGNGFAYTMCNQYFCSMTGRTPEEVLGRRDSELFTDPEELRQFHEWDMEAVKKDGPTEHMISFTGANGLRRTHAHWFPLHLTRNRHWLFMFMDDVTEVENARNEAAENAEWFKRTLNSIGDGVLTTDVAGHIVLLNPIAEQMLGCSLSEAVGKKHEQYFNIVSAIDESPMTSPITRSLRTGATVELANHTVLISRNGKRYHISDSAAPIRDRSDAVIGAILVFRDVTEEQENRDMLRTVLARLEETSLLTRSASFRFEPVTRDISGTKLLDELLPIRDGKLAPGEEWVYLDDLKMVRRKLSDLYSRICSSADLHFRANLPGGLRYYRIQIRLERKLNQKVLVGAIQDVTEITRNAGELKSTQELWDQVINSIPVMFFAKDVKNDCRYTLCNRTYAAYFGKTPEEVIGLCESDLEVPPHEMALDMQKDEECLQSGREVHYEKDAHWMHGRLRRFQIIKSPFVGADGRQMILGMANDITDMSNLIASERANSEILAKVVRKSDLDPVLNDIADTLMVRINCDRVLVAKCNSEGCLRLHKEWVSEGIPSIVESGIEKHYRIWDENLDLLRSNKVLKISSLPNSEFAGSLNFDSHYKTVSLIVAPIFIEDKLWGAIFSSYARQREFGPVDERFMTSCANVIAIAEIRERQMRDIQKTNIEKQMILNNIRIPIWLHDGNGELVRVNTAVEKLAGIPACELTTERNLRIFHGNLPPDVLPPVYEVLKTGTCAQREVNYGQRDYIVNAEPIKDESGKIVYIVKSAVDVTDLNALIRTQKITNFCLETLLRENDPMQAIHTVLRVATQFISAARSVIVRMDLVHKTVSPFTEYASEGLTHIFDLVARYPYTSKPNWEERFAECEYCIYPDLQTDSGGLGNDWMKIVNVHDIRTLYANRILCRDGLWGYVAFVYQKEPHVFDEYEIKFLRALAHFIEFILERKSAQEQLLSALQKAQAADKAKVSSLQV